MSSYGFRRNNLVTFHFSSPFIIMATTMTTTMMLMLLALSSHLLSVSAEEPKAAVSVEEGLGIDVMAAPPSGDGGDAVIEEEGEDGNMITLVGQKDNPCAGKKPLHGPEEGDEYFKNVQCIEAGVKQALEQAGANVTKGYNGEFDAGDRVPIVTSYKEAGLCPVNVHWHLGAEHLSVGQFDENGTGPTTTRRRRRSRSMLAEKERLGFQCNYYNATDEKFTKPFDWKHCEGMQVGQTYEVHWPHSAAGMCGTEWQMQTPFYDGVFCKDGIISLSPLNTFQKIGVQAQVYTIVNDETYYNDNLLNGWIEYPDMDVAKYTGSTTGTTRSNEICSRFTPITWQVDRKCHMVSASSIDKLCEDMKAQKADMSDDLHAHGARELVADQFAADNHQRLH